MNRIAALLFDCDGVLVDTTPLHIRAFAEALRAEGGIDFDYAEIAGLSTRDAFRHLAETRGLAWDEAKFAELTRSKQASFRRFAEDAGRETFPDHSGLFRDWGRRYRIAVVSSASRESVDRALRRCGIDGLVDVALSAEDVVRTKPDPFPYAEACRRLGVAPTGALVIEDAEAGLRSGAAAGCETIGMRIAGGSLGRIDALTELAGRLNP